jgi:hypothetical protein
MRCGLCAPPAIRACAHGPCALVPFVENPIDAFAYLQPGFELEWEESRRERAAEQLARAHERGALQAQAAAAAAAAAAAMGVVAATPTAAAAAMAAAGGGEVRGEAAAAVAPPAAATTAVASAEPPSLRAADGGDGAVDGDRDGSGSGLAHSKAAYIIDRIDALRREARAAVDAAERAAAASRSRAGGGGASAGRLGAASRGAHAYGTPPRPRTMAALDAPSQTATSASAELTAAPSTPLALGGGNGGGRFGGGGGNGSAGPRVVIYAESTRALNVLGHFLILRYGEDAVAQFWGKHRASELDKFRNRRTRTWRCEGCPGRCGGRAALAGAGGGGDGAWRDVEWPETRCPGRVLRATPQLSPLALALAATAADGAVGAAAAPPAAAAHSAAAAPQPARSLEFNEEDAREHAAGVRWAVGQPLHVPVAALPPQLRAAAAATGEVAAGGWVAARLDSFRRCNAPMPAGCALSERALDCFILLLARDGSHGLDLPMVSHLFLTDQIWDAAVEAQVVSRAFRMGATRAVVVEQLLMGGTVEAAMHAASAGAGAGAGAAGGADGGGRERSGARAAAECAQPPTGGKRTAGADADGEPAAKRLAGGAAQADMGAGEPMRAADGPSSEPRPALVDSGGSTQPRRRDDGRVSFFLRSLAFLRD